MRILASSLYLDPKFISSKLVQFQNLMAEEENPKLFHCFVPHKHRIAALHGFVRTHINDKIIIASCSTSNADYIQMLMHFKNIQAGKLHGKQEQEQRDAAIKRYNENKVNVLSATTTILQSTELSKPTWLLHWDIPLSAENEIKLINKIKPAKYVLFIDPSQKEYIEQLKSKNVLSKELAFKENILHNVKNDVTRLRGENHLFYRAAELGYQELIRAYVDHEDTTLFSAPSLPLLDVAINFGITAPPKLPLTK